MPKPQRLPCGRNAPSALNSHSDPAAHHPQAKLRAYVDAHQLKNSESRNKILAVMTGDWAGDRTHFTSQELLRRVDTQHPEIGAATVYRNIPVLVAAGIIQESLTQESGEVLYELAGDTHHDHIVCVDCGAIFEFHEDVIERAQEKVMTGLQFKSLRHKHVIYAQCTFQKNRK